MCLECGADVGIDAPPSILSPVDGMRDGDGGQPPLEGAPGEQTVPTSDKGALPNDGAPEEPALPQIGEWSLVRRTGRHDLTTELWEVRRSIVTQQAPSEPTARLVLYPPDVHIDPAVQAAAAAFAPLSSPCWRRRPPISRCRLPCESRCPRRTHPSISRSRLA